MFPLRRSTQGNSFHQLRARFGADNIVDFQIDNFIFALSSWKMAKLFIAMETK